MFENVFKKLFATFTLFIGSLSSVFAGAFYLAPTVTYVDFATHDSHYVGLNPALYAGYGGWTREWLYLAAEVFGTTGSINLNNNTNDGNTLKTDYNIGISVVPLVNLDDVLFGYLRLGYIQTKFKDVDDRKGAYQIGGGIEGNLMNCWDWRAEYVYTPYSSMQPLGSIRSNQVSVSLVYRFEPLLAGYIN